MAKTFLVHVHGNTFEFNERAGTQLTFRYDSNLRHPFLRVYEQDDDSDNQRTLFIAMEPFCVEVEWTA